MLSIEYVCGMCSSECQSQDNGSTTTGWIFQPQTDVMEQDSAIPVQLSDTGEHYPDKKPARERMFFR